MYVRPVPHQKGASMPIYEPSLKMMNTLLNAETRNVLSVPLVALILSAVSQVEATMELTNRVCDRYFAFPTRQAFDRTPSSTHKTTINDRE
jgi:hypothetical protein